MKNKRYELRITEDMQDEMKRIANDGNLDWSVKIRNFIQQTIDEENELVNEIKNLRNKFKR